MDYQVKIDIFEGPMDLLLHLIQKDDLDIYDIPIADITTEYLKYIDLLKELNLNLAGEFLLMASTLMQIKARTLLPQEPGEGQEQGPDPREELVQRIIEYQKFREVSSLLAGRFDVQRDVFYRGAPLFKKEDQILDVSLHKLLDSFKIILESAETQVRDILVEEIPVEVRIREILDALENQTYLSLGELFPKTAARNVLVVTFLALLELVRLKQIRVAQQGNFSDIHIQKRESEELPIMTPSLS